jgi:hypothetical protein
MDSFILVAIVIDIFILSMHNFDLKLFLGSRYHIAEL